MYRKQSKSIVPLFLLTAALALSGCSILIEPVTSSGTAPTPVVSVVQGEVENPDVDANPTPGAAESQAVPQATATSAALVPAGWATYTSQQCEYAISYPAEIEVTDQTPYSQTFAFKHANQDGMARNFLYVSLITPEIQKMVDAGIYDHSVYNYQPSQAGMLLDMQVGEIKALHANPNVGSGFTYQRLPDTLVGGATAQAYENAEPWEFPRGTKEIRYFVSRDGCTYLIGGYVDTTGSTQAGAITEDLFQQIIATIQMMP